MSAADNEASWEAALAFYFDCIDCGQGIDEKLLLAKFPNHANELQAFFSNQLQLNAKLQQLGAASLERNQLQIRCPNCHQPTRVAVDSTLTDLTCGGCGSQFNLVNEAATATNVNPPTLTMGRFRLFERLGMGAFGSVWKGHDVELDRAVAIKIPRQGGMTAEEQEKFLREARAAAQLRHPNIVSVHEVGREDHTVYIVSDFVRGVTLADWLTGAKPTGREAAKLCATIADALEHAHEKGVVHRDLKPANVMIDDAGVPHLMDFGLARRDAGEVTLTIDGQVLGTPAYMSPEQAEGKAHAADRRSDVYSLGVILFELLTGELPFRGNVRMIMHQVINDEPPGPRALNTSIPKDLETITLKCLEKAPSKRYQSASELGADLRRFLASQPILARPIGRFERGIRFAVRRPSVAASVVLLIATTLISSALSAWAIRAERDAERERNLVTEQKQRATKNEHIAEERLAAGLTAAGDAALAFGDPDARRSYVEAWQIAHKLGISEHAATTGLLASYAENPPPIMGADGLVPSVGGFDDHAAACLRVAWSPNELRTYSIDAEGIVRCWDPYSGVLIRRISTNPKGLFYAKFSRNVQTVATFSRDRQLQLWDLATGRLIQSFGQQEYCSAIAISPHNDRVLSSTDLRTATLWDTSTGKEIRRIECEHFPTNINCAAFSRDGTKLIIAGGAIGAWDADTGKLLKASPNDTEAAFIACAASPTDETILLGSNSFGLWDLISDAPTRAFVGGSATVTDVSFSPDGKLALCTRQDKTVTVWRISDGNKVVELRGHLHPVSSASFSPDSRFVFCGDSGGECKLWAVTSDDEIPAFDGHDARVVNLAIGCNGRIALSAGFDNTLRLWDTATCRSLRIIPSGDSLAHSVSMNREGRLAVSGHEDGSLALWNLESGQRTLQFKGHGKVIGAVEVSPNGKQALSASEDRTVKLWDLKSGSLLRTLDGHKDRVRSAIFCDDGKSLLSASYDGTIKHWDIASGKLLYTYTGHSNYVHSVAYSSTDRTFASGDWNGIVSRWSLTENRQPHFVEAAQHMVLSLAFSDQSPLLYCGSMDGALNIWDMSTMKQIREIRRHQDGITSLAFCSDANCLLTASRDKVIRRWCWERPREYEKFAKEIPQARASLVRDDKDAAALITFGKWYAFRGVDDLAIHFWQRARESGGTISNLDCARIYWRLNRHTESAQAFREAIKNNEAPTDYLERCLAAVLQSSTTP